MIDKKITVRFKYKDGIKRREKAISLRRANSKLVGELKYKTTGFYETYAGNQLSFGIYIAEKDDTVDFSSKIKEEAYRILQELSVTEKCFKSCKVSLR